MLLGTERLRLRWWQESEAYIQRQLWTERDPRVPAHRRIDADGRPTLTDLTTWIRTADRAYGFGLPAVEVVATGQVIGCCGLVVNAKVPEGEPELAYELLTASWGNGYATEAARCRRLGPCRRTPPDLGHRPGVERRFTAGAGQGRLHRDWTG